MGPTWLKIGILYLIFGLGVGHYMSYTIHLNWASAHAHTNLLGMVVTSVIGLTLCVYPHLAENGFGKITFWLYHIGVPIFLFSAYWVQIDPGFAHIFTFIGGPMVLIAIILFTINLYVNLPTDIHKLNRKINHKKHV